MAVTLNGVAANHYAYGGSVVPGYPCFIGGFFKPANITNPEGTILRQGSALGSSADYMFAVEQINDGLIAIVGSASVYNYATQSGLVAGVTVAFLGRFFDDTYRDIAINTTFSTPNTTPRGAFSVGHSLVTVGAYSSDGSSFGNPLNGDLSELFVGQGWLTNDEWIDFVNGRRDINRMRGGGIRGLWHLVSNGTQQNAASNPAYVLTQSGTITVASHPPVTAFVREGTPRVAVPAVLVKNQRWLTPDGVSGMALSGYGTWTGIYDYSPTSFAAIVPTDYMSLINDVKAKGCNYIRTFVSDYSRNAGIFNTNDYFAPLPWGRSLTAGHADGGNKFDLTTFDAAYFTRLRAFLQAALDRDIYVSVMLFEGLNNRNPISAWIVSGHPFASGNNINGISADANASGRVEEVYTLSNPSITALQEAYIRKVIDETHDFPNVLYEPANEPNLTQATYDWLRYIADYIRSYQRTKPATYRNLVIRSPGSDSNDELVVQRSGQGDVVVPSATWTGYSVSPNPAIPSVGFDNHPRIWDTDHQGTANVVYSDFAKALLTGHHLHLMDDFFNIGGGYGPANVTVVRRVLGDLLSYTKRMDLANVLVKPALASTGYCLAKEGEQYLFYQPGSGAFTADLSAASGRTLYSEWLNIYSGLRMYGGSISGGSATQTLTPPFSGTPSELVVYLSTTPLAAASRVFNDNVANYFRYGGGIATGGAVTILAKIKPYDTAAADRKCVFIQGMTNNGAFNNVINLTLSGNEIWAIVGNGSSYGVAVQAGVVANQWNNIAIRIRDNLYRDCVLENVAGTPDTTNIDWSTRAPGQCFIGIDNDASGGGLQFPFNGEIAEVIFCNCHLTVDEITDYNTGKRDASRLRNVRARWKCNQVTGNEPNAAGDPAFVMTEFGTVGSVVAGAITDPYVPPFVNDGTLIPLPANPRYVSVDGITGLAIGGQHSWNNVVDIGNSGFPPTPFDWQAYYDGLLAKGQNFFRLWNNDLSQESATEVHYPLPWPRTGPGNALDGRLRFDLTKFDDEFFSRIRVRALYLWARGAYCSIMLFEGWGAQFAGVPWRKDGHPFTSGNNINGMSADANANGFVEEVYSLDNATILSLQQAYVQKMIDVTHDLPNVLYEPCNEGSSINAVKFWESTIAEYIYAYQRTKPAAYRQMVWRTPSGLTDETLTVLTGPGAFGAPNQFFPGYSTTDSAAIPANTIPLIYDTDHFDPTNATASDLWRAATRGHAGIALMDDPAGLSGGFPSNTTRNNVGYVLFYLRRMTLARCAPSGSLSSTGYCLANTGEYQYLFFQPGSAAFTGDLSAAAGVTLAIEWLNTNDGSRWYGGTVAGGSAAQTLTPPFAGTPSGIVALVNPSLDVGGGAVNAYPIDDIAINDQPPGANTLSRAVSDSLSVSELNKALLNPLAAHLADLITVAEFRKAVVNPLTARPAEAVATTDAMVRLLKTIRLTVNAAEAITASESFKSPLTPMVVRLNETLTALESIQVQLRAIRVSTSRAETVAVAESITTQLLSIRLSLLAVDTVGVSEFTKAVVAPLVARVAEAIATVDAAVVTLQIPEIRLRLNDAITVTEFVKAVVTKLAVHAAEPLTVADVATAIIPILLAHPFDQVSLAEFVRVILPLLTQHPAEPINVAEYINAMLTPSAIQLFETITVAEYVETLLNEGTRINKQAFESITVSELVKLVLSPLAVHAEDAMSAADVVKATVTPLTVRWFETLTISESVSALLGGVKPFEQITVADVVTVLRQQVRLTNASAEAVAVVDFVRLVMALTGRPIEVLTVTDVVTVLLPVLYGHGADAVVVTELLRVILNPWVARVFDSVTVQEFLQAVVALPGARTAQVFDQLTVAESVLLTFTAIVHFVTAELRASGVVSNLQGTFLSPGTNVGGRLVSSDFGGWFVRVEEE